MKKNLGDLDKIIRIAVAIIIAVLYFTGTIQGTLAYILLAVAGIFLATSLINFCPLYSIFNINSCKVK